MGEMHFFRQACSFDEIRYMSLNLPRGASCVYGITWKCHNNIVGVHAKLSKGVLIQGAKLLVKYHLVHKVCIKISSARYIATYRIVLNKCAGRRGRKRSLNLVQFQWNLEYKLLNTLAIYADNLIEISSAVAEIQPYNIKSRGCVYLSRRVHLALYSIQKGERAAITLGRSSNTFALEVHSVTTLWYPDIFFLQNWGVFKWDELSGVRVRACASTRAMSDWQHVHSWCIMYSCTPDILYLVCLEVFILTQAHYGIAISLDIHSYIV